MSLPIVCPEAWGGLQTQSWRSKPNVADLALTRTECVGDIYLDLWIIVYVMLHTSLSLAILREYEHFIQIWKHARRIEER